MTNADKPRFAELMTELASVYNVDFPARKMDIYWRVLSDLRLRAFTLGCEKWLKEGKFWPVPANLREASHCPPMGTWEHPGFTRTCYTCRAEFTPPMFPDESVTPVRNCATCKPDFEARYWTPPASSLTPPSRVTGASV